MKKILISLLSLMISVSGYYAAEPKSGENQAETPVEKKDTKKDAKKDSHKKADHSKHTKHDHKKADKEPKDQKAE